MKVWTSNLVTVEDIFDGYDLTLVTGNGNIKRIYKCADKSILVKKIFVKYINILLENLIENNTAFLFPTRTFFVMQIRRIPDSQFKKARQAGAYRDVDILKSNFRGYEFCTKYSLKGNRKEDVVKVGKKHLTKLIDKTNEGSIFTAKSVSSFKDYLPSLFKEFPEINEKSISTLVRYGLSLIVAMRRHGHDIYINNNTEAMYLFIGDIINDSKKRLLRAKHKTRDKHRRLYILKKKQRDQYYYFTLTDEEYANHLKAKPIDRLLMFKVKKEACLRKIGKHLLRVKIEGETKWALLFKNYETINAEHF